MANDKKLNLLIETRLKKYATSTDRDLLNAAKEIVQEIALLGLSRHGFFKKAAFHGGTALRLFYGLDRFSEDLDFALTTTDYKFSFSGLLEPLREEAESWGLEMEVTDRSKLGTAVKKAFLKEKSLGAQVSFKVALPRDQKLKVKLELDVNPPSGATYENKLCEFPTDFYVRTHDEATLFAGKLHAILCREFIKGRDWYDLAFYFSRKSNPNTAFLRNALNQIGPFAGTDLPNVLNLDWLNEQLSKRIRSVNFVKIKVDVEPFLKDPSAIDIWSTDYFLEKLKRWHDALYKQ